ncbi:hypothetical protein LINGRAPRIM_LOCUS886 [Linum grandiflorum]
MSSTTTAAGGSSTTSSSNGNNRSKAIRRRSRVSKKTPITLLNTDATNFRSLVQQFTGCPHPPSSSTSFQTTPLDLDANRGPINLNFQLGTVQTSNHGGGSDQTASSMVNYQHGEEMTRMGGQNHMEMVQELLMLDDDAQDDFGLFR